MQSQNITGESSAKTLKDLAKACNRPRGIVANVIDGLIKNEKVKKVAKNGHSCYFLSVSSKK